MSFNKKDFLVFLVCTLLIPFAFATVDPSFDVSFSKSMFQPNETLSGFINLTLAGSVYNHTKISVELDDEEREFSLSHVFELANISCHINLPQQVADNPQSSKTVHFSGAGSGDLAFKLPYMATVRSSSLIITGNPSNPPSSVSLDINNDGFKEWIYYGDFEGWDNAISYPSGLDITHESDPAFLSSSATYYCERIYLPESKAYRVLAKYKRVNSGADIKAVILSLFGNVAEGGANFCDLPDNIASSSWNGCNVEFGEGRYGNHLVCVYIENSLERAFELSRDDSTPSSSRYDCPDPIPSGSATCIPKESRDYFITVQPAVYSMTLDTSTDLDSWGTEYDFSSSLTTYLRTCSSVAGECIIPLAINSGSAGELTLSNMQLDYTELGGTDSYTQQIYDLVSGYAEIDRVDNKDLSDNITVYIPLSVFNLTVPDISSFSQSLDLKISFSPGPSRTTNFTVYSSTDPPAISHAQTLLDSARYSISSLKANNSELTLFDLFEKESQLNSFESRLNLLKAGSDPLDVKVEKAENLTDEINDVLDDLPNKIKPVQVVSDNVFVTQQDVSQIDQENQLENFAFQSKVDVKATFKNYEVTYYSLEKKYLTLITKEVVPKESFGEFYLYEIIPKSLASNLDSVMFASSNYEVVNADPVIRYLFTSSQPQSVSYGIEGSGSPSLVYDTKTIVVPKSGVVSQHAEESYECGDDLCTVPYEDEVSCPEDCGRSKIPWIWIIIIMIFIMLILFFFYAYKGRWSLRGVLGRKSPFKSDAELMKVKDYIKGSLKRNIPKHKITQNLIAEGWSKNQVLFAYESFELDNKKLSASKLAPLKTSSGNAIVEHIKKCKALGMDEHMIRDSLIKKGWPKSRIDSAFEENSKKSFFESLNPVKKE